MVVEQENQFPRPPEAKNYWTASVLTRNDCVPILQIVFQITKRKQKCILFASVFIFQNSNVCVTLKSMKQKYRTILRKYKIFNRNNWKQLKSTEIHCSSESIHWAEIWLWVFTLINLKKTRWHSQERTEKYFWPNNKITLMC